MSSHMYNLNLQDPVNIVVCSVCFISQEVPPPCNSVKVRFCLGEWTPAGGIYNGPKCEVCCSCRTCTYAYLAKYVDGCTYELMMEMAVFNYMELPVGFFELYCSMDLE